MIYLITAVPGSGKTLRTIGMILKFQSEGRKVYANINGLLIPDVLPAPDDWRETPDGSVVIYDECQEIYPSDAKPGVVHDERLTAMERHRHTGHDLVFITQAPTFVHHHIRKLVGEHQHLYRPNGMAGANVYTWGFACIDPNDRREQERADHLVWKFPKEHYKLYKSATVHTHKFRIPVKITIVIVLILLGAIYPIYHFSTNGLMGGIEKTLPSAGGIGEQALPPPPPPITSPYQWAETPPAIPVAGCISTATRCQCFSAEGVTLALSHDQCLSTLGNPFPRTVLVRGSKDKG